MAVYDLAIVGGGPAGASAAITAARLGLRTALFERGADPEHNPRDKVCGEFLSAEGLPILHAYIPDALARAAPIASASFVSRSGVRAGFALPQPARGLSRLALDAALWRAASAAGAECQARTAIARVVPEREGLRLTTATGEMFRAAAAILASGRVAGGQARGTYIGAKARFAGLEAGSAVEIHALRHGYCGLAPVEGGWINVCCLVRQSKIGASHSTADLRAWLASAGAGPVLLERLRPGRQATGTVVTAGLSMGGRAATAGRALRAGDASGFVDPFTGDGIARALLSGRLAAAMLAAGAAGRYPAALAAAAAGGMRTAAFVRAAVSAPGWMQTLACRTLAGPWVGPRLTAATRWHTL